MVAICPPTSTKSPKRTPRFPQRTRRSQPKSSLTRLAKSVPAPILSSAKSRSRQRVERTSPSTSSSALCTTIASASLSNWISTWSVAQYSVTNTCSPKQEVNTLLNAAPSTDPKVVSFKYFILCFDTLSHAPHLFVNDSPLLLIVTALKDPHLVSNRLKRSGALPQDSDINAVVARLLQDFETRKNGAGYVAAFGQLQAYFQNMWNSKGTQVMGYLGYRIKGSYSYDLANNPPPAMFASGMANAFLARSAREEARGTLKRKGSQL